MKMFALVVTNIYGYYQTPVQDKVEGNTILS